MNTEDKLREHIAIILRDISHRGKVYVVDPDKWDSLSKALKERWLQQADEILDIPELKQWAMEKWNLVENGTVKLSTLPIKKRPPLIIGD